MLETRQNTWSLFSNFRLSQLRRRDSSNTNTPSNVRILRFNINCTIICEVNDNALFDIVLCFSVKAKERSQINFAPYIFHSLSVGIIILIDTDATSIKQNLKDRKCDVV